MEYCQFPGAVPANIYLTFLCRLVHWIGTQCHPYSVYINDITYFVALEQIIDISSKTGLVSEEAVQSHVYRTVTVRLKYIPFSAPNLDLVGTVDLLSMDYKSRIFLDWYTQRVPCF